MSSASAVSARRYSKAQVRKEAMRKHVIAKMAHNVLWRGVSAQKARTVRGMLRPPVTSEAQSRLTAFRNFFNMSTLLAFHGRPTFGISRATLRCRLPLLGSVQAPAATKATPRHVLGIGTAHRACMLP